MNITLQSGAISATVVILFMVIIWCTILNLGYAYRNSIVHLLNDDKVQLQSISLPALYNIQLSEKFMVVLACILYFGGAISYL
ncbi:MAG: hypothetical protein LUF02_08535 [Erysipelotrichaceae bacterium]|nr:hypothetical protein [Erysipelotrichaceae bacterium]